MIDERALDNYLKMVEVYRRREEQMEVKRKEMMESEMRGVKGEMEEQETFFSHNFDAMVNILLKFSKLIRLFI